MADEEAISEERRKFILEQRAADEAYTGPGRRSPGDMSFVDRSGKVVHPDRDDHYKKNEKLRAMNLNLDIDCQLL